VNPLVGLYLIVVMFVDYCTRTYPWWLLGIGVAIVAYLERVSMAGIVVGGLLCLVADTPGGDFRFAMVLGAMVGPVVMAWTLAGAFAVTLIAWRFGLTGMPWTVYIGLMYPIISTVLSTVSPIG
jgi:hypothetical protein